MRRSQALATIGGYWVASGITPAAAQTATRVRVGAGTVESNAQVYYALEQGFFKKNGLDVQLNLVRSGGITMEAIVAGELDIGIANTVSLGGAILKKIPFIVFAPGGVADSRFPDTAIVVAPNAPFKVAKDFNGQTIGVTSLGSIDFLSWGSYMDASGGNYSSLKFIEIAPSAMAEAVATGRVAAALINDPGLSSAVAAGKVRAFVPVFEYIAKVFYETVWFSNRDWLTNNKDTARRFADAVVAGGVWAESNRAQSLVVLEKYTKYHEEKSMAQYGKRLTPAQLQPVWDGCYKYKIYDTPLRAADYCWDGK